MGTIEISLVLVAAEAAVIGYFLVRYKKRSRIERMTRSLRRALERESASPEPMTLERAS